MNYPNNIEQKLGFDSILEHSKRLCLTESGQMMFDKLRFLTDCEKIEQELSIVDEMREILVLDYNFPLSHFDNLTPVLDTLNIEDAGLDLPQVLALKKFMDVLRSVVRFFEDEKHQKFKNLARLSGQTIVHKYVIDQINAVVNNKGEVKDNASHDLLNIRRNMRTKRSDVSRKINAVYYILTKQH